VDVQTVSIAIASAGVCDWKGKWNIRFIVLYEKALQLKCARCIY
jgi:hypothetical protein